MNTIIKTKWTVCWTKTETLNLLVQSWIWVKYIHATGVSCLFGFILVTMRIVSQAISDITWLSLVKKILALINIEREFLSVDIKMTLCKYFLIGEIIWEKQINIYK